MYEIRIFQFKGQEMPFIYHRETMVMAMVLLAQMEDILAIAGRLK